MSAKKAAKKKVNKVAKKDVAKKITKAAKKNTAKTVEGADTEGAQTKTENAEVDKSGSVPTSPTDSPEPADESDEIELKKGESHPPLQIPNRSQVVSLAVQLVAAQLSGEPNQKGRESIPTLDDASYDTMFQGAIYRIEKLLHGPVADTTVVFAEQLFSDSADPISTEDIRKTFIEWEWPDLLGRKSVVNLMPKIEGLLFEHLLQMESDLLDHIGISGVAEREFIRAISDFCRRRIGTVMHGPLPEPIERLLEDIRMRVLEFYGERLMSGESRNLVIYEHAWNRELVKWCLGDREPKDPDQHKGQGEAKYYRPWALFRYLRIFGGESKAFGDLQKKLQQPRNRLSPHTTLRPLQESYPRDFPLFNEMFEGKLSGY